MNITKSFFLVAVLALVLSANGAPAPREVVELTGPLTVTIPSNMDTLDVSSRTSVPDVANNAVNEVKRITKLSTSVIIGIAVSAAVLLLLLIICCCCCCCGVCK